MGIAVMCLGSLVVARSTLSVTTERSSNARVREGLPRAASGLPSKLPYIIALTFINNFTFKQDVYTHKSKTQRIEVSAALPSSVSTVACIVNCIAFAII